MLETMQERVELLKAGISGKRIENMYITGNNMKMMYSNILYTGSLTEELETEAIESEEFSARLEIATKICACQDELKEVPFYKFSARNEIKHKIQELESKLLCEYRKPLLEKFPGET